MNWITNWVRPKIKAVFGETDVPDNLWHKCGNCGQMIFHRDLDTHHHVCQHCGHHMRLPLEKRLNLMFDDGKFTRIELPKVKVDPLKFRDRKRYTDRLREAQSSTRTSDAIIVAHGRIDGENVVVAAFNFAFMGGSMGMAVGEAIIAAARLAVIQRAPLITVPASGGARMQEGILSLMQLPRTTIAVEEVREAGLPYIVLLTDPTTGGVSASFAMLGDIHIAEPGAQIGFAGRRVIEQTVRETLPDGFQTSEYLLDHGMVDMVVPRAELREVLGRVIRLLRGGVNVGEKAAKKAKTPKSGDDLDIPAPGSDSGDAEDKPAKDGEKPGKTSKNTKSGEDGKPDTKPGAKQRNGKGADAPAKA